MSGNNSQRKKDPQINQQQEHYERLWAKVGDWKHESPHFKTRVPQQETLEFIQFLKSQHLTQGAALDLGCGGGRHTIAFAQAGFVSTGIDYSSTAIQLARKDAHEKKVHAKFITGDVLVYPFEKQSYDVVHDAGCLHHLTKAQRKVYLKQVINALKPGGYYKLFCFSNETRYLMGRKPGSWMKIHGHYTHFFSKSELEYFFGPFFEIVGWKKESRKEAMRTFLIMYARRRI